MNSLIHHLMEAGFSEYEARAYVALTRESPLTAYEIARKASIPTSKVYGVVARLSERGILGISGAGKRKSYVPVDKEELIEGLKSRIHHTLTQIEGGLSDIRQRPQTPQIINLRGYGHIIDKARRMIASARMSLLVSLWKEEAEALSPSIGEARERYVKCAVVHFGAPSSRDAMVFQHPADGRMEGGRGLVVVADSHEALTASVSSDGTAEGAVSTNRGFVFLAEEYIRHDIYFMKLTRRFDRHFRQVFGQDYEFLRDVFSDEARR